MIDSSPSSAESSFRELDDVFLQTQTRIWLGELLNLRLDEDLPLSDLLQDGEILFEVSKLLWDLLLTKCMEIRPLKHKYGPFGSKTSSGRYRPYSNVDSFLKICKILGLSGIDLFSPSDIVEKRDIRKVCICIRALSKKTRSKQLSVPDFDMVRHSVAMPTDMVGILRKSLELSQCTFSSSSSYGSQKQSQLKLKQKNLHAPSNRDDDSISSEESDEAESSYMGENSFSSGGKLENADGIDSALENLHGTRPTPGQDRIQNVDNFTLENDGSFMGDSSCIDAGENNYISDYLAFSDLMVHATDSNNSVVVDGENNMFDFFLNVDSQKTTLDKKSFSQRAYSDDEDMEVSSTTSMSSVLGRLLNLEYEHQFDEDDSSSTNVHPSVSKEDTCDSQARSEMGPRLLSSIEHFLQSQEKCETSSTESRKGELCDAQPGNSKIDLCPENRSVVVANDNQDGPIFHESKDEKTVGTSLCQTVAENHTSLCLEDMNTAKKDSHIAPDAENVSQDKREDHEGRVAESISDERKDTTPQPARTKHDRRPLLKTVVKGTAIAGLLLTLLHIYKSKGNNAQETTRNGQILKLNGSTSSSTKQQTSRGGIGRYPTQNIKF
ncbi:hypothetical protein ACS0TY_029605 [Phlomoides rotata]